MCGGETKVRGTSQSSPPPTPFALCLSDCFAGFLFPPETNLLLVTKQWFFFLPLGGVNGLKETLSFDLAIFALTFFQLDTNMS